MKYFDIGHPFETDAVVNFEDITCSTTIDELLGDSGVTYSISDNIVFSYEMSDEDHIFGLGENMKGLNKRGGIYESFCSDDPHHAPDKKSLYGAHNFFMIKRKTDTMGMFIDFPGKIIFDFGFTDMNKIEITLEGKNARIYFMASETITTITKAFLKAIGPSYLPPKWSFGYQQSRWSYEDEKAVTHIADEFDKHDLPIDAIYLDIDYLERFKNFTIDQKRFPKIKQFISNMKTRGLKLIPIIDAGCKIEAGYDVYEEGVKKGYYCVDENNQPFIGAVWPGKVHFPDFINPAARKWFGDYYTRIVDLGIEGFWNDMNEPSIFYSEKGLNNALEYAKNIKDDNLGIYDFFELKDKFMKLSNQNSDYQSFYHRVNGQTYNHYDLHNLYGYNMTRAAGESFETHYPEKRVMLFSRASYIGMHRYGGIWTGDNHAWWEHLLLNIKMMPSLNMCGFLYSGADVGGFGGHANAELLIRWSQFAIFTPLFRNHSCLGTRHQEPYNVDEKTTTTLRHILKFRYALITFLYSEFMKVNLNNDLLFKPLCFEYNDPLSLDVEDQLLFGNSMMLAPIYTPNGKGRYVYLPESMMRWQPSSNQTYDLEILAIGHHYIPVELDSWLTFIKKNKLVILNTPENRVNDIKMDILNCIGYIDDQGSYELYLDDGISRKPAYSYFKLIATYNNQVLTLQHEGHIECQQIIYDIMTSDQKRHKGVYNV